WILAQRETADADFAARGQQPADHAIQQRALAAAVGAHQDEPLCGGERYGDAFEHRAPPIAGTQLANFEDGCAHCTRPRRRFHSSAAPNSRQPVTAVPKAVAAAARYEILNTTKS